MGDGGSGDTGPRDGGVEAGVCGNDVVEADEACEPGLDPCCADDCGGPRAKGDLCRAAVGECDRVEKCDGTSVACPLNRFVTEGAPCGDTSSSECDGWLITIPWGKHHWYTHPERAHHRSMTGVAQH